MNSTNDIDAGFSMNTTNGIGGQQGLSNFEIWSIGMTVLGVGVASVYAFLFYKFHKKLKDWEYRYAFRVPLPPTQLSSPRRSPPKTTNAPTELDKTNLTSLVLGLQDRFQIMASDIEHLERDIDRNYKRTRQLGDENEEIDETLGEFRAWMKRTKETIKEHEQRIDDLDRYFDQHERDLEAIAFSPSKIVPNTRFDSNPNPDSDATKTLATKQQ